MSTGAHHRIAKPKAPSPLCLRRRHSQLRQDVRGRHRRCTALLSVRSDGPFRLTRARGTRAVQITPWRSRTAFDEAPLRVTHASAVSNVLHVTVRRWRDHYFQSRDSHHFTGFALGMGLDARTRCRVDLHRSIAWITDRLDGYRGIRESCRQELRFGSPSQPNRCDVDQRKRARAAWAVDASTGSIAVGGVPG